LPYAEIILVATLWGFSWRMLLHACWPDRFKVTSKTRTPIEKLVLWGFGLWAALAVIGIVPALIRNLQTSPAIPLQLFAVKVAFAPVWGLADESFPLTMAIRVLLAFFMVVYVQRLVRQQDWYAPAVKGFVIAMALAAVYALVQFLAEVGYSKGRLPYYIQSTFHENEGFATFNLLGFMIAFPFYFLRESKIEKILYGLASLLFLAAIMLSNSRALLLLAALAILAMVLAALWVHRAFFALHKKEILAAILIVPLLVSQLFLFSPHSLKKFVRLARDVDILQDQEFNTITAVDSKANRKARERQGSLTLVARLKLWESAGTMLAESYGLGMGTGTYYRLTGFPRYQALYKMENAHLFWLQLMAELGLAMVLLVAIMLAVPGWLGFTQHTNSYQQWMCIALFAFWFCNVAGQSLTQQEIMWYTALMAGLFFVGGVPVRLAPWLTPKVGVGALAILLAVQAVGWGLVSMNAGDIGVIKTRNDTYGYAFDGMGHRYLRVGTVVREDKYIPWEGAVLEFRVRAVPGTVSQDQPLRIKAMFLDEYNRVVAANQLELTDASDIHSLFLPLEGYAQQHLTALLTTDRVQLTGNLLKSEQRKLIGFWYYGNRWKTQAEVERLAPPSAEADKSGKK
jgi:hypothetical protein